MAFVPSGHFFEVIIPNQWGIIVIDSYLKIVFFVHTKKASKYPRYTGKNSTNDKDPAPKRSESKSPKKNIDKIPKIPAKTKMATRKFVKLLPIIILLFCGSSREGKVIGELLRGLLSSSVRILTYRIIITWRHIYRFCPASLEQKFLIVYCDFICPNSCCKVKRTNKIETLHNALFFGL